MQEMRAEQVELIAGHRQAPNSPRIFYFFTRTMNPCFRQKNALPPDQAPREFTSSLHPSHPLTLPRAARPNPPLANCIISKYK